MTAFNYQNVRKELENIANWWMNNTVDELEGGFVGEVDHADNRIESANKGIVLNSRILWFFSELAIFTKRAEHQEVAKRAFNYLLNKFDDKELGGAVWELRSNGDVFNSKKQTYAQCFCIYAFSAYYQLTKCEKALEKATEYFELVERYARDHINGGYVEACSRDWKKVDDYRLSEKDLNTPKSMNTHLHVLEAYAAFYKVSHSESVEKALRHIIDIFVEKIIDEKCGHQRLFFDMDWQNKSTSYSYGHDIEASWLLWEAVEILNDERVSAVVHPLTIQLALTCQKEAIGQAGQVCDEYDFKSKIRHEDSEWWVQAEALVGFANAFHLTGKNQLLDVCSQIWQFIDNYHLDKKNGEWHWFATSKTTVHAPKYKMGFWKAPYHNGRAMMELCRLFEKINAKESV